MKLKIIFILSFIFMNSDLFSQNDREKIFFTPDSLSFIHLLPNQQFGFVSYKGNSPLIFKEENKGKRIFCGPYFTINEFGSGEYSIIDNKIHLNFIKPKHPIDSISINKKASITDSINIKITFKSYIDTETEKGIGSIIKSSDNSINIETMFHSFASFTVHKEKLPLELIINGKYPLKIESKEHHDIILFVNDFKNFTTDDIEKKIFTMDSLTEQTKK